MSVWNVTLCLNLCSAMYILYCVYIQLNQTHGIILKNFIVITPHFTNQIPHNLNQREIRCTVFIALLIRCYM